jgi:hypothetical protein
MTHARQLAEPEGWSDEACESPGMRKRRPPQESRFLANSVSRGNGLLFGQKTGLACPVQQGRP